MMEIISAGVISQITIPLYLISVFDVLSYLIIFAILTVCFISTYILPLWVLIITMMVNIPNFCIILYVLLNAYNPFMVLYTAWPDWPLKIWYNIVYYAKFMSLESWKNCVMLLMSAIGGCFMVESRYPGFINEKLSYFFPPQTNRFLITAY